VLRTLAKERGFALLQGEQGGFKFSGCPAQAKTDFSGCFGINMGCFSSFKKNIIPMLFGLFFSVTTF
jgi:hypothetical protein